MSHGTLKVRPANGTSYHRWYDDEAEAAWGDERPTLQETRVHAKCLRSVTSVRDYFREYRAKKRGVSVYAHPCLPSSVPGSGLGVDELVGRGPCVGAPPLAAGPVVIDGDVRLAA